MTPHGPDTTAPELDHDAAPAAEPAEDLEDLALQDDYGLNPDYVERVIDAADRGDDERLRELVDALRPADVADLMGFLTPAYREALLPLLAPGDLAEILTELDDNIREDVLESVASDTLALAGVTDVGRDASILEITQSRFWWLLVNLGTAVLAASVIGLFQGQIEKLVALAVLNPIAASMGGNAGTQTLTVAVRALATKELSAANMMRTIWRESVVGLLNGVAFAVIMGAVAGLWFHDLSLAVVAGLAMVVSLFAAAVAGILIPLTLDKLGHDPAVSSVVFLTTVTDCIGYFRFLGLATVMILNHH